MVVHEFVEGKILIKGADHRIPELPGIPSHLVLVYGQHSVTFSETHHIQPVTPPPLSKMRTLKKPLYQIRISLL